jgi:hypothetical protein
LGGTSIGCRCSLRSLVEFVCLDCIQIRSSKFDFLCYWLEFEANRFTAISVYVWELLFEPIDALELSEVSHAPGFVIVFEQVEFTAVFRVIVNRLAPTRHIHIACSAFADVYERIATKFVFIAVLCSGGACEEEDIGMVSEGRNSTISRSAVLFVEFDAIVRTTDLEIVDRRLLVEFFAE